MNKLFTVLILAIAITNAGCVRYVANPKFDNCSNACSTVQNKCMLNASTADEVEQCKTGLNSCIVKCEGKYQRYFKR